MGKLCEFPLCIHQAKISSVHRERVYVSLHSTVYVYACVPNSKAQRVWEAIIQKEMWADQGKTHFVLTEQSWRCRLLCWLSTINNLKAQGFVKDSISNSLSMRVNRLSLHEKTLLGWTEKYRLRKYLHSVFLKYHTWNIKLQYFLCISCLGVPRPFKSPAPRISGVRRYSGYIFPMWPLHCYKYFPGVFKNTVFSSQKWNSGWSSCCPHWYCPHWYFFS